MYAAQAVPITMELPVRGQRYCLHVWGVPPASAGDGATFRPQTLQQTGKQLIWLLHGWMDVGASWQFMVDALAREHPAFWQRHILIAPDWRGFGSTRPISSAEASGERASDKETWGDADHFHFPDYLADLDALLTQINGQQSAHLLGHSMGANVALMYSGIRPAQVAKVMALEGFGLPRTQPAQAPGRYAQWLDELAQQRQGQLQLKPYTSREEVAQRLMRNNPRLPPDKALWLAGHWSEADSTGQWRIRAHPAHKVVSAQLYRLDELLAIYSHITAPVLAVEAEQDNIALIWQGQMSREEYHQRLQHIRHCQTRQVPDAGHMLHHDQPSVIAALAAGFF